jgi:nitrogen fixation/metabolism regulation signal transduction histidine kinase
MIRRIVKTLYDKVIGSLDNQKGNGFSARKLTSAIAMTCYVLIQVSWLKHAFLREDYEYIIEILVINACFILLLLGIITMEQVISFKKSNTKEDKDVPGKQIHKS